MTPSRPTRPTSKKAAPAAAARVRPSHLDDAGKARMVDVGAKPETQREAVARGRVFMHKSTLELVRSNSAAKGDVLTVAKIAAIGAAKRTAELIPLAHTLGLDGIEISFALDAAGPSVAIEARVASFGRTGVEMEALTAVSVAALTIYDMLKAVDRGIVIGEIALWEKRGGKSGDWRRDA
jgi:cyclic pyranopterin phosphate synthase